MEADRAQVRLIAFMGVCLTERTWRSASTAAVRILKLYLWSVPISVPLVTRLHPRLRAFYLCSSFSSIGVSD